MVLIVILLIVVILALLIIVLALSRILNRPVHRNNLVNNSPQSFYEKKPEKKEKKKRIVPRKDEFSDLVSQTIQKTDTIGCLTYTQYLEKCADCFMELYGKKIKQEDVVSIFKEYDDEIYNQYMDLIKENCDEAIELENETKEFNQAVGAGDGLPDIMEDLKIAHPEVEIEEPLWDRLPDTECIEVVNDYQQIEEIKLE